MGTAHVSDLYRVTSPPAACSYLPIETCQLDYRICGNLDADNFGELLRRGWRRFGTHVFRPACPLCRKCRPIRVVVDDFEPSKSQRRTLRKNEHISVTIQPPSVSREHVRLYDAYHADMAERRDWPHKTTTPEDYFESFIGGKFEFAREILYWDNERLVGVGLVDVTSLGLSSAYFFHDPNWRPLGPGTFSALMEIEYARQQRLPYVYLGFWISENQSMAYKSRYEPHELLQSFVGDHDEPDWRAVKPVAATD